MADAKHYPLPALCPITGKQKTVKLQDDIVKRIRNNGPFSRFYDIAGDKSPAGSGSPVQDVLKNPSRVFEHIREHQTGGQCYCGIPTCGYTNGGAKIPPHPGMVYCVYVNPADWFFESGWEPADPDDPLLPLGWRTRYKEVIWPKA